MHSGQGKCLTTSTEKLLEEPESSKDTIYRALHKLQKLSDELGTAKDTTCRVFYKLQKHS